MQSQQSETDYSKVDERGHFLPFRGFTVISNVLSWAKEGHTSSPGLAYDGIVEKKGLFDALHSIPEAREYFAWLPWDSYHMTGFGVLDERDIRQNPSCIDVQLPALKELRANTQMNLLVPELIIRRIVIRGVVLLEGDIAETHSEKLEELAHAFPFNVQLQPRGRFHVTLGYKYRSFPDSNTEKNVSNQIHERLHCMIGSKTYLARFNLCYFKSMTKFIPWEKDTNPFEQAISGYTLGSLFGPEPQRWGLRGDRPMWNEMREQFMTVPLPSSSEELMSLLKQKYTEVTGQSLPELTDKDITISDDDDWYSLPHDEPVYQPIWIERFNHGGMSGGSISPDYWQKRAFPLLKNRFEMLRTSEEKS